MLSGATRNKPTKSEYIEIFGLQGCKPAYVGSWLATFQEAVGQIFQGQAAQEYRVIFEDGNERRSRNVDKQLQTYEYIEIFGLKGCKSAYVGSWLATFQEAIGQIFQGQAAQEDRVIFEDGNERRSRNVDKQLQTYAA